MDVETKTKDEHVIIKPEEINNISDVETKDFTEEVDSIHTMYKMFNMFKVISYVAKNYKKIYVVDVMNYMCNFRNRCSRLNHPSKDTCMDCFSVYDLMRNMTEKHPDVFFAFCTKEKWGDRLNEWRGLSINFTRKYPNCVVVCCLGKTYLDTQKLDIKYVKRECQKIKEMHGGSQDDLMIPIIAKMFAHGVKILGMDSFTVQAKTCDKFRNYDQMIQNSGTIFVYAWWNKSLISSFIFYPMLLSRKIKCGCEESCDKFIQEDWRFMKPDPEFTVKEPHSDFTKDDKTAMGNLNRRMNDLLKRTSDERSLQYLKKFQAEMYQEQSIYVLPKHQYYKHTENEYVYTPYHVSCIPYPMKSPTQHSYRSYERPYYR